MKTLFLNRMSTDQIGTRSTMKQLILILALSVFAIAAQARGSELQISLWNNQDFEIQLDQERFYADYDFEATDLRQGKHRIRITQRQANCYGNGGSARILFNGYVNVPRDSRVIAEVRANKRLRILQTIPLRPIGACGGGGIYGSNGGFGSTYDQPMGCSCGGGCAPGMCQGQSDCGPSCGGCSNSGCTAGGQGSTGYGSNGYGGDFLSTHEVDMLISDLKYAWFDSDRVTMVEQRLRHKQLSSYHVKRILLEIDFESNRVELAKFAFDRVNDQANFCVIHEVFDFQSSINEIHDYIYGDL
jgi:hypothetical protein